MDGREAMELHWVDPEERFDNLHVSSVIEDGQSLPLTCLYRCPRCTEGVVLTKENLEHRASRRITNIPAHVAKQFDEEATLRSLGNHQAKICLGRQQGRRTVYDRNCLLPSWCTFSGGQCSWAQNGRRTSFDGTRSYLVCSAYRGHRFSTVSRRTVEALVGKALA